MTGFTEYVLKVSGRCNLNCSYCYMFNLADQSWRGQPRTMSRVVLENFAQKSIEHATETGLTSISVGLHGGEPLLLGKKRMIEYIDTLTAIYKNSDVKVKFGLQTNGVLIDDEWADLLFERNVNVGLSIDGPEHFHDQYRVTHDGKGSYQEVLAGLRILQDKDRKGLFPGIISVINADISPQEYYSFIKDIGIAWFDVRMPLHHYGDPPLRKKYLYSEWYIELFNLWFNDKTSSVYMRFFNELIDLLLGSKYAGSEMTGIVTSGLIVIESDGTLEPSDNLKACGDKFTKTKLSVNTHPISDALSVPIIQMARKAEQNLPSPCQQCKYKNICGGGLLTNRFSPDNGFDNPTIYCEDMKGIIQHIADATNHELERAGYEKRVVFN